MSLYRFITVAALANATLPGLGQTAAKPAFEYSGYLRSGVGFSRGGADQVCFRAFGSETGKYRLGNECETYLEASFTKRATSGGATFGTHLRFAATSAGHRDWEPTTTEVDDVDSSGSPALSSDLTLALREAYVEAENIFGSATPWVGKRFYRRHDVHVLDFYTLDNSGPGFGVENVALGDLALHTAVTRNISDSADGPAQTNLDLRLSNINLKRAGSLEAVVIYGRSGKRGHRSGTEGWTPLWGTHVSLFHLMPIGNAKNKVTLQYGQGLFGARADRRSSTITAFGGQGDQEIAESKEVEGEARKKSSAVRIIEELSGSFGKSFSIGAVALYQHANLGGLKDASSNEIKGKSEVSLGARPVLHVSDHVDLAVEVGTTKVHRAIDLGDGQYQDAQLTKLTLAPQVTPEAGFWARPSLRFFATYATWNEQAKGLGDQAGVFGKDVGGFSTGAQIEAWW